MYVTFKWNREGKLPISGKLKEFVNNYYVYVFRIRLGRLRPTKCKIMASKKVSSHHGKQLWCISERGVVCCVEAVVAGDVECG